MSSQTECSAWSPEDADSLDNVEKQIQLVSTSSESNAGCNSMEKKEIANDKNVEEADEKIFPENSAALNNLKKSNVKLYSSCHDLSKWHDETAKCKAQDINNQGIKHSSTFISFKHNKKHGAMKYDHVQSKIKHYFNNKNERAQKNYKTTAISDMKEIRKKEDYLEEINKQLTKELDEKNAILSLLQENYERLLFKYAEAQNRIDELRFKQVTDNSDYKNSIYTKCNKMDNKLLTQYVCNDEFLNKTVENQCQRAAAAPFNKSKEHSAHSNGHRNSVLLRPLSLPLENNLKVVERDLILTKATTPTDSEGLSSIITSMSGHSKILNSLDEENEINKKSNMLKCQSSNFIFEENNLVSDSFDKVKNWQNSLPPLEQIETPETALYNVFSNNSTPHDRNDSSPKNERYEFIDDSCPPSWRDENYDCNSSRENVSYPTLPLTNSLRKRNASFPNSSKKTEDAAGCDGAQQCRGNREPEGNSPNPEPDISSSSILQRRRTRGTLLRCSSLPAYDCDSIKSVNYGNDIYIPPLDLRAVTLSDEESYCQRENCLSKCSGSSYDFSRGNKSFQTMPSFNSSKNTISDDNSYSRVPKVTTNKSTSITPEKSEVFFISTSADESQPYGSRNNFPPPVEVNSEFGRAAPQIRCKVCGESLYNKKTEPFFPNRSISCESVRNSDAGRKRGNEKTRPKPIFKRSISFGSDMKASKQCVHRDRMTKNLLSPPSQESLENFDTYANSLKARSQVAMKALTAHVNKS